MATKRATRNEAIERSFKALESGLRGLEDISEELAKVQKNLRKYLDEAETDFRLFPRKAEKVR
jgi:uncharacterized protein YigA (DUF484 family)